MSVDTITPHADEPVDQELAETNGESPDARSAEADRQMQISLQMARVEAARNIGATVRGMRY